MRNSATRTMFAMGFQPGRKAFFLGQALSQTDRDHYLTALNRGLSEVDEIDAWIKANPTAQFNLPVQPTGSTLSVSPYYTKYYNFIAVHPSMLQLRDRLASTDPTQWTSLTDDEHTTFGWVSVLDQVYTAFKADPLNLTAGNWQSGSRVPGVVPAPGLPGSAGNAPASSAAGQSVTIPIINAKLPPTIAGIPTPTVLVGGGAVAILGLAFLILR